MYVQHNKSIRRYGSYVYRAYSVKMNVEILLLVLIKHEGRKSGLNFYYEKKSVHRTWIYKTENVTNQEEYS